MECAKWSVYRSGAGTLNCNLIRLGASNVYPFAPLLSCDMIRNQCRHLVILSGTFVFSWSTPEIPIKARGRRWLSGYIVMYLCLCSTEQMVRPVAVVGGRKDCA